jgi:hypothetical protein
LSTSSRQNDAPALRALSALTLCFAAGCAAPPLSVSTKEAPEFKPEIALFEGWRDGPRVSFERDLKAWNPSLSEHRLRPEERLLLNAALAGLDEAGMRAALLLTHSRDPHAAELLLARLEDRVEGAERNADGADVVAAASLAAWPPGDRYKGALTELSIGSSPHPDLEVRVECASSALARGGTEVSPFLLRVLREGTPAEERELRDWTPKSTMAWSKSRAATALSLHLGAPVRFRADASYEDQLSEISALESLLGQ